MGRRHDRLSPPADRQPVLHAEPRGSGQGAGGGGALRRGPDAARGGGGRVRPRCRPARRRAPMGRRPCCRRAPSWSPPAPSPTPCWRARTAASSSTAGTSRRWMRPVRRSAVVRGLAKPDTTHVLMHRADNGRFISFFGDLHPSFFGNVVKAMGGAKRGYPVVSHALAAQEATRGQRRRADRALPAGAGADGACGAPADTDHRRGGGARARPGARLPAGPVLPAAELRDAGAAHRRGRCGEHRAGDGRPGDDRRLDRSRARAWCR